MENQLQLLPEATPTITPLPAQNQLYPGKPTAVFTPSHEGLVQIRFSDSPPGDFQLPFAVRNFGLVETGAMLGASWSPRNHHEGPMTTVPVFLK